MIDFEPNSNSAKVTAPVKGQMTERSRIKRRMNI